MAVKKSEKRGFQFTCPRINVNCGSLYVVAVVIFQLTDIVSTFQMINPLTMCRGQMNGIIIPDPNSCESYFRCDSGSTTRQVCRDGTLFDLNLHFCVAEHIVKCGSRARTIKALPTHESHHAVSKNERKIEILGKLI